MGTLHQPVGFYYTTAFQIQDGQQCVCAPAGQGMLCLGRKSGSRGRIKWKSNLSHNGAKDLHRGWETEDLVTDVSQMTVGREGLK